MSEKLRIAAALAFRGSLIGVLPKIVHYTYAAHRDERGGFPYTAAMEWRQAAELFHPDSVPADYCWRKWERIIHLPRQLAGAIGDTQLASSSRLRIRNKTVVYDVPLATAA